MKFLSLASMDVPGFLDNLPIGIMIFGTDLNILYTNRIGSEWISPGSSIDETFAQVSFNDAQSCRDAAKMVLAGGQPQPSGLLRFNTKTSYRLLRLSWTAIRCISTSQIQGGAVIAEDVSAQNDQQQQLLQAQRLTSVGKVAGKVAHELNNPLDGILRYLNLAIRVIEQGPAEKAKDYLLQSRTGLLRMVQIVNEILEFSRSSGPAVEPTPLDQILQEAITAMEPKAGKIRIEIQRPDRQPLPRYRPDNLFQVFCNLTKNAIDAMETEGQLTISIHRGERQVDIAFRDTGSGFPAEQAETLFQPFFTTKGVGRGTGLGLAICRDLVEKLHGRITAVNNPEGGSTFTVSLPIPEEPRSCLSVSPR